MTTYEFDFEMLGELTARRRELLVAVGCGDAAFRRDRSGAVLRAAFTRDAESLSAAIFTAVDQVEIAGMEVLAVDGDELLSAAEIAKRLDRPRNSVYAFIVGQQGPGGFPARSTPLSRPPLWAWSEVAAWFGAYDGTVSSDLECARIIPGLNAVLAARRQIRDWDESDVLRVIELLVPMGRQVVDLAAVEDLRL